MGTALGAPLAAQAQQRGPAEVVFRGGRVLTMTGNRVAEAVAVAGGRISYVGADSGLTAFMGPATEVVELRGRTLMPGIHDAHMHPLSGGLALTKPTASMQLQWAERDSYTVDSLRPYIGDRRWRYTYPAGSLEEAGARLCGGSDWPVDPLLPFRQIEMR